MGRYLDRQMKNMTLWRQEAHENDYFEDKVISNVCLDLMSICHSF